MMARKGVMKQYIIQFSGSFLVEAENEQDALEQAKRLGDLYPVCGVQSATEYTPTPIDPATNYVPVLGD